MQTRRLLPVAVAMAAAALALPAWAQSTTTSASSSGRLSDQWRMPYQRDFWGYIGATAGRSDFDVGCVEGFSCDQTDTGFKIFAGGKLYNALGLEIGYVDLGRAHIADGSARAYGGNVSLVVGVPIMGDRFGINGKIGTTYGWTKTSSPVPGAETGNDSGWGLSYGVGATYAFTPATELRLDWDRYRFDFRGAGNQDVDLWSAGLNFRF